MKKRLFYLAAFICCAGVLASCSKDNENTSWKQLPQNEISASDASLTVNGAASTAGSLQLSVLNAEQGTLTLKNVVGGYASIPIDVTLVRQSDDSYTYSGEKALSTAPVKSEGTVLTVKVSGTATTAGKLTASVTLSGVGLLAGTYTGSQLALKYSGGDLTGKSVTVDVADGGKATLTLKDILPGQSETALSDVQIGDDGKFEGQTTASGATVNYNGTITGGVLTLSLNVKIADPSNWAKTYSLAAYTTGPLSYNGYDNPNAPIAGALYVNYVCAPSPSEDFGTSYGQMFRGIGGVILPQVLKSIILDADGNIRAEYCPGNGITFEPMWAFQAPTPAVATALIPASGWVESPNNLAYWFEKDGQMRVKLNIEAIVAQSAGASAGDIGELITMILNMDAATLKQTLAGLLGEDVLKISDATISTLLDWVKNGFPMTVGQANGHTYLYLDKNAWDPIMKVNTSLDPATSDILILWDILSKNNIIPSDFQMASMLIGTISGYWSQTDAFDLGLDLQ